MYGQSKNNCLVFTIYITPGKPEVKDRPPLTPIYYQHQYFTVIHTKVMYMNVYYYLGTLVIDIVIDYHLYNNMMNNCLSKHWNVFIVSINSISTTCLHLHNKWCHYLMSFNCFIFIIWPKSIKKLYTQKNSSNN